MSALSRFRVLVIETRAYETIVTAASAELAEKQAISTWSATSPDFRLAFQQIENAQVEEVLS